MPQKNSLELTQDESKVFKKEQTEEDIEDEERRKKLKNLFQPIMNEKQQQSIKKFKELNEKKDSNDKASEIEKQNAGLVLFS